MVEALAKTCMIVLVVLGSTPYVYCQDAAADTGQEVGAALPAAGTRGIGTGEAGEDQPDALRDPFWPVGYAPSRNGPLEEGATGDQESVGETSPEGHNELDMTGLSDEEQAIIKARSASGTVFQSPAGFRRKPLSLSLVIYGNRRNRQNNQP